MSARRIKPRRLPPPEAARHQADAIVESGDSILRFKLNRSADGVHVYRAYQRPGEHKLEASLLIPDEEVFLRWIDDDPQRFEYPVVFDQLRRSFHALVDLEHNPAQRS